MKCRLGLSNFGDGLCRHMPASEIAKADHAEAKREHKPVEMEKTRAEKVEKADVLVAGSLAIDLSCDFAPLPGTKTSTPIPQTSNPAIIEQSLGGVGHNVAIAASRVGSSVLFCSAVGDDLSGRAALTALQKENLTSEGIQVLSGARTAQYVAVNDTQKDLVVAMADMGIMERAEHELDFDQFWEPLLNRTKPRWVVVDANWSPEVLAKWITVAKKHDAKVAFEPVSTAKCRRLFTSPTSTSPGINLAAPNQLELTTMYTTAYENNLFDTETWWYTIDAMGITPSSNTTAQITSLTSPNLVKTGIPQQAIRLLPFIPCIITKLGPQGVLLTQLLPKDDSRLSSPDAVPYILSRGYSDANVGGVYMRLFEPAVLPQNIVSVNGAGDTLLGVVVAGLASSGKQVEDIIPAAQEASVKTLMSAGGVGDLRV